ncbi:hypothetical protein CDL12_21383 [Handroanthus impetiginosus]|uniref:VQ domain-containing protein n=1 Tax=Handroanthus impetiginosus TaxID=429701 RepID=A0A2G9GL96_9LAMI|nr:hypothetical protein CDL12_21383 [Handroanthus impetiginosus]
MAISQTMSNPSDWMFQSYQNTFSNINQAETSPTIGTTSASRYNNNLSPGQGRISKPVRRRSRVSSRTPTTVLNTDAANFRAMVQHFTGAPTAPFSAMSRPPSVGATAPTTTTAAAPASGFHVQYPNQLQQQQQHQHQHIFMIDNMQRDGGGGGAAPPETSANENPNYSNYMF